MGRELNAEMQAHLSGLLRVRPVRIIQKREPIESDTKNKAELVEFEVAYMCAIQAWSLVLRESMNVKCLSATASSSCLQKLVNRMTDQIQLKILFEKTSVTFVELLARVQKVVL